MSSILIKLKEVYNGYMLGIMVFAGLFLLLRDVPLLKKKNLNRDRVLAKTLGYVYILGGISLFILLKIL